MLVSQGQSVADAIRSIGVTEVSYYRSRREFGGLKRDQVKRMDELEAESARLRRAVADLTFDKRARYRGASSISANITPSSVRYKVFAHCVSGSTGTLQTLRGT